MAATEAQLSASEAAIGVAAAQLMDTKASVEAARAATESIKADMNDGSLGVPRYRRVQLQVRNQPKFLAPARGCSTLGDLGDVSMTFFPPPA
jgi:HlyD family secretion protein